MNHTVAVILAAGLGTRLQQGHEVVKPLVLLDGQPILLRTLDTLARGGVGRAIVVLGFRADDIRQALDAYHRPDMTVQTVLNPHFHKANGLSVLAAKPLLPDRFLLTMSDHLLDHRIIRLAGESDPGQGVVLCVDRKLDTIFDMDDATKVLTRDQIILRIGKELTEYNAVDTGVFHCSSALLDALQFVYLQRQDCSLSDGMQALAAKGLARTLDIGDLGWQDVDTPQMLEEAARKLKLELEIGVSSVDGRYP
ncbi:MAG: NTP transferase domain-containing protein [Bradymonadales bacterium]|nr:NTP transferase domain-containing protein [Bradymonadales bacterium]